MRGTHGEIRNREIPYSTDYPHTALARLERINAGEEGNLEGLTLREILFQGRALYRNPYPCVRLSDEELAVSTALRRMAHGVATRTPGACYSLADACEDRYLDLLMERAIASGEAVRSEVQPWH